MFDTLGNIAIALLVLTIVGIALLVGWLVVQQAFGHADHPHRGTAPKRGGRKAAPTGGRRRAR